MPEDTKTNVEIITTAIKEVGFPVVAFLLMFYMCFVTLKQNTVAIDNLTDVISLLV